tara:strand:- start:3110 stop:3367 length:258 start_codon:yes stop_codon:yes gene_type:complete
MRIVYKKHFNRQFKKLSPKIKEQFYERLEIFLMDKFASQLNNHSVERAFPGCRSINITGDYRALFQEEESFLVFVFIGAHSDLYG